MTLVRKPRWLVVYLVLALHPVARGGVQAAKAEQGPDAGRLPRTDLYGDPLPPGAVARMGTVRFRHGQHVSSVAFAPNGKLIASAGSDETIRLWERATGRELRRLTGHQDVVRFVTFTPDGKHLISASGHYAETREASVRLWEVATGKEVGRLLQDRGKQPMLALALSADGKILAAGNGNTIWLVEVPRGRGLGVCRIPAGEVKCIRFTSDTRRLAAFFDGMGLCLFEVKTGQLIWQNMEHPTDYWCYEALAVAPDGRTLVAATSSKHAMRLLDATTGQQVRKFEGEHKAAAPLLFSRDGQRVFSAGWGQHGIIWDVASGKPTGVLEPPLSGQRLVLSPDGKTLAEAGDRAVRFWDAATGKGLPGSAGAIGLIDSLDLSPDGKTLLTASCFDPEAGARLWDLETGRQKAALIGQQSCGSAVFAPDGKTFAARCFQGTPVLANVGTGRVITQLKRPQGDTAGSLTFIQGGKLLLGTGWFDTSIRVWDVATGGSLPPLGTVPQNGVKSMALSPNGRLLATGGMDRVIRLWDVAAHKEIRQLEGQGGVIWAMAFSPDGQRIAAVTATGKFSFVANGTDRTIRLWDVGTGRQRLALEGPAAGSWSIAWSPDGRVLATGGEDSNIRLWELATATERAGLAGHQGPVSALLFTPEGKRLISASSDTTALVWDVRSPRLVGGKEEELAPKRLDALWADLASADAAKAYQAILAMTAAPKQSVPFLAKRLRPVPAPDPQKVAQLLKDLQSERFALREKAGQELAKLGELVASELEKVKAGDAPLELRRRVEQLLEKLQGPITQPEQLRGLRAVEVLENVGSAEAQDVLRRLAKGAAGARLTREAAGSLQRLAKRAAAP
jgi:WD40 repeat protein